MSGKDDPSVGKAYALDGPEAVRALYRDWASSYDTDFVARLGYVYAQAVAELFAETGGDGDAPILDVGCGSGAVALGLPGRRIDGIDLSPEMLDAAGAKGSYTRLIEADLLARLPLPDGFYRGVVSAGTFTHGHVGPEALGELLRVAAPGALFCIGVNAEHFRAQGFGDAFAQLHRDGAITDPRYEERAIYSGDHDRAGDRALVAVFRRR